MKKIIALLTAGLVLVAALSGCAGKTAQSMDGAAMPQTQTGVQTLSSKSEEQTTLEDNYEFSSEILAEPNDIRYTDVPGMPTQDFVLSFEDVKNEKTYDVTVEEPDKLTSNALSDIYNFVQTEQCKPVRYFDEEVQKAVEELLPNGVSVDILHMTEFMQVLLEKTEDKNSDAKATVIIDADYVPNRLVIVMIGDRQACKDDQDLDAIEWTPLKASVTEVGKIEFVLPAELLEKVEGDDIIFSVLTDRIGTHGGVIRYKDGEIIITYPSKTAEDTVAVQDPVGESGTKLPEDFKVSHVVETEAINKEVAEMRSQRAEKKTFISFYPLTAQREAQLLLPDGFDMDSLVTYEILSVDCVNYKHTYGDVLVRFSFATPFKDGQTIVAMLGLERENRTNTDGYELDWVALRAEVKDGYVDITFPQVSLEVMEEHPALLAVLSEPLT